MQVGVFSAKCTFCINLRMLYLTLWSELLKLHCHSNLCYFPFFILDCYILVYIYGNVFMNSLKCLQRQEIVILK